MRLESDDIRRVGLFKYYRLVRKWACKTYKLTDADLELLIHFDCLGRLHVMITLRVHIYIHGTNIAGSDYVKMDG